MFDRSRTADHVRAIDATWQLLDACATVLLVVACGGLGAPLVRW